MTMQYQSGDIWRRAYECGGWVVIPTNTTLRKDGLAVMGAGLAKEAAERFPALPQELAAHINRWKDRIYVNSDVICLPTKRDWRQSSTIELIGQGCYELVEFARLMALADNYRPILIPRLGCGLGGLDWERQVRPVVDAILEDDRRFVFVSQT